MASKLLTREESVSETRRVRGDYDWSHVFGESSGDSTGDVADGVGEVSLAPFTRSDILNTLCVKDGENDGDSWMGVFQLVDGRYVYATGWCDYTGWG